jgi:hypothetical protein
MLPGITVLFLHTSKDHLFYPFKYNAARFCFYLLVKITYFIHFSTMLLVRLGQMLLRDNKFSSVTAIMIKSISMIMTPITTGGMYGEPGDDELQEIPKRRWTACQALLLL